MFATFDRKNEISEVNLYLFTENIDNKYNFNQCIIQVDSYGFIQFNTENF